MSFASFFFVAATDGLGAASALGAGASRVAVTAKAAKPAKRPDRRYREHEVATGDLLSLTPTGLAVGFGPESPYRGAARIHPRNSGSRFPLKGIRRVG
ncbi:hypothetical protein GCM10023191_099020 [Actinoallomurus oryzae]|uniref:Uncharacterized protein n=1 Tax=Actinoallomurus oryzae TaxID=502180 RepID=A0ABP8R8Q5_9ACTN